MRSDSETQRGTNNSTQLGLPIRSLNRRSFWRIQATMSVEIFSQEGQKGRRASKGDWGSRCRRRPLAVGRTGCLLAFEGKHFWFWSSKNKNALSSLAFLPFCPSALPVKISEALDKIPQQGSSPKRSLGLALRRYGSFCKGSAARQPKRYGIPGSISAGPAAMSPRNARPDETGEARKGAQSANGSLLRICTAQYLYEGWREYGSKAAKVS